MKRKNVFVIFTVFAMLFSFVFQASAITVIDLTWQEKITAGLYEKADQKDDRYFVSVWLKDIPDAEINAAVYRQTGFEVAQYENEERYATEIVPAIKQQVTNELSAKVVSRVFSTDEVKAKQELALSENYNGYISAKRQVMEGLFSSKTKSFVEKSVSEPNEIWFQGTYLPVVILYATRAEIEAFAKNPDVVAIDPFVNSSQTAASTIEEQQIKADDWDGTKGLSYNYGSGYRGVGVKIGIMEAWGGCFNETAPQLASIVGTDPENPNGKRLFYIANEHPMDAILAPITTEHATMVTSIIVGQSVTINNITYEGVAPDATVYQIPVSTDANTIYAIEKLIDLGVSVINYSGGDRFSGIYKPLDRGVDYLICKYNISYVNGAGNINRDSDDDVMTDVIYSPAMAYNAISVGAVNTKASTTTALNAPYSLWVDSCFREERFFANKPDIVAPGVNIYWPVSPTGDYTDDGTSYAAPMVAGVVAQLHQVNSALKSNPTATKAIIWRAQITRF